MIAWAPITAMIDWYTTTSARRSWNQSRPSELGQFALEVARREIGRGESGGNNRGTDITVYRGLRGGRGPWCSAFISYCLLEGAKRTHRRLGIEPSNGARRLFMRTVEHGMLVKREDIMPGDLVLWARGNKSKISDRWKAHIGIISEVEHYRSGNHPSDRKVLSWKYIAGNEGEYPALVKEKRGHNKRLIGFARA